MNKITHDLVEGLGPVESKKLFMFVEPDQVPAFPKGREDNTHLNVYGARVIAGLAVEAIGKAVPELAPYIRHYDYVVISSPFRKRLMRFPISVRTSAPRF